MDDVTAVGLQQQYEAVTENLSLIAYLIQSEPTLTGGVGSGSD